MPAISAQSKRPASQLDQQVVERMAERAKARDEMRTEIGEHRDIKAHLLEGEADRHSSLPFAADPASAELPDVKGFSKEMLRWISPIGETSPAEAQLSSEWSSP
jgi:hypothetical protein